MPGLLSAYQVAIGMNKVYKSAAEQACLLDRLIIGYLQGDAPVNKSSQHHPLSRRLTICLLAWALISVATVFSLHATPRAFSAW